MKKMMLMTALISSALMGTLASAQSTNIKVIKSASVITSKTCTVRLVGGTSESSDYGEWDSDTFNNGEKAYLLTELKSRGYTYVSAKGNHGYNAKVNQVMLVIDFKYGKMPKPIGGHAVSLKITDYSTFDLNNMMNTQPIVLYSIYGNLGLDHESTAKEFFDRIPPCERISN